MSLGDMARNGADRAGVRSLSSSVARCTSRRLRNKYEVFRSIARPVHVHER